MAVIGWIDISFASARAIRSAPAIASAPCSEDAPCPAQISAQMDYKETYTASEDERGHSSADVELTVSGTFSQKLRMTYLPDGTPEFDEVPDVGGASSGSFKLAGESQQRSVPQPDVLWDHKVLTMAAGLDDAHAGLADSLASDGSPVIVGGVSSDPHKVDCKTTGNMHEEPTACPATMVMPVTLDSSCQDANCVSLGLQYELHPDSDRPAPTPTASDADKRAAAWLYYTSDTWYGTRTTALKAGSRVSGYEVTFDGTKAFTHKGTPANPGDASVLQAPARGGPDREGRMNGLDDVDDLWSGHAPRRPVTTFAELDYVTESLTGNAHPALHLGESCTQRRHSSIYRGGPE